MEKFEKNSKVKDHVIHIADSGLKAALSFIPAGPILDGFLNYGNNLRQKRIIDFAESLKKILEKILGEDLHASNFETEDFVDIMQAVYSRVQNTRSANKLESFRNILVNQIIEPRLEIPLTMKFIQLLEQLDDLQLLILNDFRYWKNEKIHSIIVAYQGIDGPKENDDYIVERLSKKSGQDVSKAEVEYFTNELVSLGLIRNNAVVITAMGGSSPQNDFKISPIGESFLKFIELNGPE